MALPHINITKILKETGTTGSSPLLVMDDRQDTWFAKSTTYQSPYTELINEVICNRMANFWGFLQPQLSTGIIEDEVLAAYTAEVGPLSVRYRQGPSLAHKPFICSRQLAPALELEEHTGQPYDGREWKGLLNRSGLAKIALFDMWICNKDRQPHNPNVLLHSTTGGIQFVPFDHTAAFASFANLKAIPNTTALFLERRHSLISHPFTTALLTFDAPNWGIHMQAEVLGCMQAVLDSWEEVTADVPAQWGFSRAAKARLHQLLSDSARNQTIAATLVNL